MRQLNDNVKKISTYLHNDINIIDIKFIDLEVKLSTLGASIIDIKYIDLNNNKESIVAHPVEIDDFINNPSYYGKTCGQSCGRIDKGIINILDNTYQLDNNWNNLANLHGGLNGISDRLFTLAEVLEEADKVRILMTLQINDHFIPGIHLQVEYVITNSEIKIRYNAISNKTTFCNITNHTYFNLTGNCKDNALNHFVYLNSNKYIKLNQNMIPNEICDINKTFDFTKDKQLKEDLYSDELQNHLSLGYDHYFILNNDSNKKASIYDEISKRKLELYTTYPGLVMYSCCYGSDYICCNKNKINQYDAICLEAQCIPYNVNTDKRGNCILYPGDKFSEEIVFKFSISK